MAQYSLNFEEGGGIWYVHVAELLGCFTRSHNQDVILQEIPTVIQNHLNWLVAKGQRPISSQTTIIFNIAEEIRGVTQLGKSGGTVALFKTDNIPVTRQTFDNCLTLMSWTRQDLLQLVTTLPVATWNQRNIPNKRPIDSDIQHIANTEEWYISRFGRNADAIYRQATGVSKAQLDTLPTLNRLTTVRQVAVQTLKIIYPKMKRGTFTRAEYTSHPDEPWTLHKVLRRFIEHEKEHIGTIQRSITHLEMKK
ncbi:MAG: DinB family protein [Candidatus Heimdallarchaeota archaeon]